MTSSEEILSQCLKEITAGLSRFVTKPTEQETFNVVYSAIANVIEHEARSLIVENVRVSVVQDSVVVTIDGPAMRLIHALFGNQQSLIGPTEATVPSWSGVATPEAVSASRPYIDPKTNRPTRGRTAL